MNVILWILQVLLAFVYLAHGKIMLFPPPEILAAMRQAMPPELQYFIGIAESLAAIALVVPGIARVATRLVPAAAFGLALLMICATVFHTRRGEYSSALTTVVLFVLCAFVAYMRWKIRPIPPRTAELPLTGEGI
jgi:uncharacterized membrane protein YphA (DoxX/SURF4 family)